MATCHPVKHRNALTASKLKVAMASAWGIGIMLSSHTIFLFEAYPGGCRLVELGTVLEVCNVLFMTGIEYLTPIFVFIYSYCRILMMLSTKVSKQAQGPRNDVLIKTKKNVLVTTMLISVMFVVCWTPAEVAIIYVHISGNLEKWLPVMILMPIALNMSVNPFIYCFKYQRFRSELASLIQSCFRRNRVDDGDVSIQEQSSEMHQNGNE